MKLWSALILLGTKVYACTVDTDCNCRYHSTSGTDLFKCAETIGSEPSIPVSGEFYNDDVLQWNENTSCSLTSDPWVCYCDENIPNEDASLGVGTCNYSRFPMPDPPTDDPTVSISMLFLIRLHNNAVMFLILSQPLCASFLILHNLLMIKRRLQLQPRHLNQVCNHPFLVHRVYG